MQENIDQSPSLSHLLRESYLAEARAQQRHSEMSRSDSSSSRRLVFGPLKGKGEDRVGLEDPQFPDLSAFLSQEELDESVNLARQAIGHDPREDRSEVTAYVVPVSGPSDSPSDTSSVAPSTRLSFSPDPPADSIAPPSANPLATSSTQPPPEIKELPQAHTTFSADRKMHHKGSTQHDGPVRSHSGSGDAFNDLSRSSRSAPYGPENQSKKEFLNKAADFIEELSSLFKANSSKRVRPRSCKAHRSRVQNKNQHDGALYPLGPDDRERPVAPLELEVDGPSLAAISSQPEVQTDVGAGRMEFPSQGCRLPEEELCNSASPEEMETESALLTQTPYSTDPVCEPPRFIQKLKSREVLEGSKVQLDCIVTGLPAPEVRWFCEGKELENCPDIQILTNGELHSLIIAEAFEEDTGRYSCFASNFYGTDSTSAEIYIEGASSSDSEGEQHFEHVLQVQRKTVTPAQKTKPPVASLAASDRTEDSLLSSHAVPPADEQAQEPSCQPSGEVATAPPQPIQVTLQSTVLPVPELPEASEVTTLEPVEDEATVLPVQVFPTSSPGDSEFLDVQEVPEPGPVADTQHHVQTAPALPLSPVVSSTLSVQVAPTHTTLPESQNLDNSYFQGLDGRPLMAAPVFTKSLQDLLALESQLVVLECRVKGVPSPKVEWYREGTLIEDSPDFRILQKKPRSTAESEEICTLVIAEVFPEDSGMFTCTASNKYGTVSSISALRVKGSGNNSKHVKTLNSGRMDLGQIQEPSLSDFTAPAAKPQPEVAGTNSMKPHSSTIRLDSLSSSTVRLDPLSTSTLRLDPHSSSMLRPDAVSASVPSLDPLSLSSPRTASHSCSAPRLDPLYLSTCHQDLPGSNGGHVGQQASGELPSYLKPFSASPMAEPQSSGLKVEQEVSRPSLPTLSDLAAGGAAKVKAAPNHHNGTVVVPLPDPPANSCLKTGGQTNHRHSRSRSRVGLRVHFRLPEDEEEDEESDANESDDMAQASKGPPPVLAKPKLDPAQLQILHNQVLLEQQQDTEPTTQSQIQIPHHAQMQPQTQSPPEAVCWSPRMQHEPHPQPVQPHHTTTIPQQTLHPAPPLATAVYAPAPIPTAIVTSIPAPIVTSIPAPIVTPIPAPIVTPIPAPIVTPVVASIPAPIPAPMATPAPPAPIFAPMPEPISPPPMSTPILTPIVTSSLVSTPSPLLNTSSASLLNTTHLAPMSTLPSSPQLKTAPLLSTPPRAPQLNTAPTPLFSTAPVTQMNTIHASHFNLTPSSLSRTVASPHFSSPLTPQVSAVHTDSFSSSFVSSSSSHTSTSQQITSPTPLLRSAHASLMNLAPSSQSFSYTRPKEFVAAQTLSPVRSPSPTESPVPMLNELAAELSSSAASSPTIPPFTPTPRFFPTRVLRSPTSPPSLVSSPTLVTAPYLNSVFAMRAQSPPQASSPTSSSSTPSPIQNPVAFLSSVLPSLPLGHATNSMGLPKRAPPVLPQGILKKTPRTRLSSDEDIRDSKEQLLQDIEKKLRFRDDSQRFPLQQKLNYEGNTGSSPLGPNNPATVFNYEEEYRVSNFEQRLMSEIEFRLERTPVEESDDEVQHSEVPTGKCIAPIFDKKLKNFRAMEGVPVTFSCKVVGIPIPKVYWFKDGKQILRRNEHYKKIREGDGTCALYIESTTNDDDGNYTVMAANPQGRISCSGHLIVQTGPPRNRMTPINSQRVRARIQEVEEGEQTQERFFRPHFLQAPGDMVVHEGRLCRLDCKVNGLPNPELMWLVNGRPIYPDLCHRMMVRENGIHSLVIDPATQNDAGTYTCIASNKAGQSSFCLELKVVEREMKQAPLFVEKLQNTGIPEGSPVRLECRVVGMPPPVIFWKKDNDTIPKATDRISMHQDPTGYVCLVIQPTRKEDAGWFTVSAKNEAGIVSCTCRLDIYAQWHQSVHMPAKKAPHRAGSRYAALTGQGLDIRSAFPTSENSPILFSSSPPEVMLESEEL